MRYRLATEGNQFLLSRDLEAGRSVARGRRVGDGRAGLIASGQARRLAAEGLFVDLKPSIAQWMLAPSGDIRSSNLLETVQNQFQIQGLELVLGEIAHLEVFPLHPAAPLQGEIAH